MGAVAVIAPACFRFSVVGVVLVLLAGCNRTPYSRSDSGFSARDKTVLYDFRSPQPATRVPSETAATRKVFSAVFPSYLADRRQCRNASATSGQVTPRILDSAEGSFTAPGLQQVLYLIDVGECNQPVGSRRLAVFTGDTPAANVEAPIASQILRTYDVDRDGKNEVLLYYGGSGGETISTSTLVEFDKDKMRTFEDFGQIYDNPCASALPAKSLRASVVYYLPPPAGQKPRFTVELYRAPCPAGNQQPRWSLVVANLK